MFVKMPNIFFQGLLMELNQKFLKEGIRSTKTGAGQSH